jgi:heptosyltransferase II
MKILIIKIGALGDVVMSLSVLEWLRENNPHAEVTWVCSENYQSLLSQLGNIKSIITVNDKRLLKGNIIERAGELIKVWKKNFAKVFDIILIAHTDKRYRLLSLFTKTKELRWFGEKKRNRPCPNRYHADEYLSLLTNEESSAMLAAELPTFSLPLPNHLQALLEKKTSKDIVIVPGGAKNTLSDVSLKRWPLENYVMLAEKFILNKYRIILTGDESDKWIIKAFEKFHKDDLINLVGKTTIIDLLSIYNVADVVVSHDTGSMHLAALSKTPIIALFGPTNPAQFAPRREKVSVLWGGENLACRPCYEGKSFAACNNNLCMKDISVDKVFHKAKEILS